MQFRPASLAVLSLALTAAACTTDGASEPAPAATSTPAAPGPLAVDPDRPEGSSPLPTSPVFRIAVGDDGTPAVVFQDPDVADSLTATRISVGADPATWSPAAPADVESGNTVGTPAVGADGSVSVLAALTGDQAFGLHVLRVAPDGSVTATPVTDAGVGSFGYRTVDAVSDDGRTAVVATTAPTTTAPTTTAPTTTAPTTTAPASTAPATTDPGTRDPAVDTDVDQVRITTVDLATATVTARGVADVGTDAAVEPLDVGMGPDGAVTVLTGRAPGAAEPDGAELVRFSPDLQTTATVQLDAGARFDTARLDLAPDGTAVVALQPPSSTGQLATRVLSVAPGSSEVTTVADLGRISVDQLRAGPGGWAYLVATDYAGASRPELLPLDLATARTADPVALCADGTPFDLARSGDASTLLARVACGQSETRLFVLQGR